MQKSPVGLGTRECKFSPLMFSLVDLGWPLVGVTTRCDFSPPLCSVCLLRKCRNSLKRKINCVFFPSNISESETCTHGGNITSFPVHYVLFLVIIVLFGWKSIKQMGHLSFQRPWKRKPQNTFILLRCYNLLLYPLPCLVGKILNRPDIWVFRDPCKENPRIHLYCFYIA